MYISMAIVPSTLLRLYSKWMDQKIDVIQYFLLLVFNIRVHVA